MPMETHLQAYEMSAIDKVETSVFIYTPMQNLVASGRGGTLNVGQHIVDNSV